MGSEALTSVTVMANVPVGVAAPVVTDIVELPEPVMDAGNRYSGLAHDHIHSGFT